MAVDPSIPLSVQLPRYGEIISQGVQQYRQQKMENELLQLKKDEAEQKKQQLEREMNLRDAASFVLRLDKEGDVLAQIEREKKIPGGGAGKMKFINDFEKAYKTDPEKALQIAGQVVGQAKLKKLIPESREQSGFTLGPGQKRFTASGEEIASVAPKASEGLSVGEKAIDKEFSKEFVEWTTGGFADVRKNIIQLKLVENRLTSGEENLTGPIIGRTPDPIRAVTHPESLDVRDQVEEVVQRNLRLILGAQFTQKEGERLIARAYNENLDEATNKKRLKRLIVALEDAALAKQAAVDYFNEKGTLKGFKGDQLTMADINKRLEEELEDEKIAKPQTQADFDKLKSGTTYISPADGKRYVKK